MEKSFKEKAKERYDLIMADLKNPIKKIVRIQKITHFWGSFLRFFIIFGLSFVIIFPLVQQITLAIRHPSDITNRMIIWIPEKLSFLNFDISMQLLKYWQSLFNSVLISAVSMVGQIICTALAGYAFARLRFKGSNIIFWILLITLVVPPQAVTISRHIFFTNYLKFTLFGKEFAFTKPGNWWVFFVLGITGQGIRASLFIYLFRQFFRGLPMELEESAQIDGATVFQTFWRVMLPNARGIMITVGLFAFVWQYNDVYFTSLLGINGPDFPIMTLQLMNIAERLPDRLKISGLGLLVSPDIRDNSMFVSLISNTSAFLMMIPLLIGYLFVQRSFVEGIERTGIVG